METSSVCLVRGIDQCDVQYQLVDPVANQRHNHVAVDNKLSAVGRDGSRCMDVGYDDVCAVRVP